MSLTKAYLETEAGTQINCLFNPGEISFSVSNNWNFDATPGMDEPPQLFGGSNPGTMSLDLIFDSTDTGSSVTSYTDQLLALMDVDDSISGSDQNSGNARPGTVTFNWADLHSFPCVIKSMTVGFTYFSSDGTPLRATVHMDLEQFVDPNAQPAQNPTSGTPRPHRVHRVQPGETLDRISARYYGDSTRWRQLAAANHIEDPLALRPGSLLAIPRMDAP